MWPNIELLSMYLFYEMPAYVSLLSGGQLYKNVKPSLSAPKWNGNLGPKVYTLESEL